jgi:hypothetical protein
MVTDIDHDRCSIVGEAHGRGIQIKTHTERPVEIRLVGPSNEVREVAGCTLSSSM